MVPQIIDIGNTKVALRWTEGEVCSFDLIKHHSDVAKMFFPTITKYNDVVEIRSAELLSTLQQLINKPGNVAGAFRNPNGMYLH